MRFFGNKSAKNGQILLKFLPNIICIISRSLSHFDPLKYTLLGPKKLPKMAKMGKMAEILNSAEYGRVIYRWNPNFMPIAD